MITALFVTTLPTLFFYILISKLNITIKSKILQVTVAWFFGIYFFTFLVFLLSLLLSMFTSQVLLKSTYIALVLMQIGMMFLAKDIGNYLFKLKKLPRKIISNKTQIIVIIFCLIFSISFFLPHLSYTNYQIFTSPVYWDFHWHASLIQNFALGDNFPPENEAFGGIAHTYHYLWAVATAIYTVSGLGIVDSINTISILAFFFLLIGLLGISEELFGTKKIGKYILLLMLTSSSFHWIYFFASYPSENIISLSHIILNNNSHPFAASFIPGFPFGYQGVFFNLFYFLEERQLIFGVLYLLISLLFIYNKNNFSNTLLFLLGICLGSFFLWHLYSTLMVFCSLLFLLLFEKERKKTLLLLAGFTIIFGAHIIYFKTLVQSPWFYNSIGEYPRLNFNFAANLTNDITLIKFINFYLFSYGLKLIFLFIGLKYLLKRNSLLFLVLISFLLPTFLLLNSIQLSPASIAENHKWLRPLNVIIDIIVGYSIYILFFQHLRTKKLLIGISCLFLLTISGIIELMPFLNSKPTKFYAHYPSSITNEIQKNSLPKDIFVGNDKKSIGLAGRKLYLGDPLGGDMQLKISERKQIIYEIYLAKDKESFCKITSREKISYVEVITDYMPNYLKHLSKNYYFSATNDYGENVRFIDIQKLCTK